MVCHDLEAFYDNMQHNVLRQAAREHGMSATLLETAVTQGPDTLRLTASEPARLYTPTKASWQVAACARHGQSWPPWTLWMQW